MSGRTERPQRNGLRTRSSTMADQQSYPSMINNPKWEPAKTRVRYYTMGSWGGRFVFVEVFSLSLEKEKWIEMS